MIRKRLIAIVATTSLVAVLQTAPAASTDTLGDLFSSGASLTIGDKTFSGFHWNASGGSSAVATLNSQAAALTVTASVLNGVYYLDFGGMITADNRSGNSDLLGDLNLFYTVTANPGLISMIDQSYTPYGTAASGQIIIGETVNNTLGITVANSTLTLNPSDLSDPVAEAGDNLNISPGEPRLYVTKDILIDAFPGQVVGLSDVKQSFHQVPEPATMSLLMFGAGGLWLLRKKKVA
jgi:hypothetical protein